MKLVNILILEDNLTVLAVIFQTLDKLPFKFTPVAISTQRQVEEMVNATHQKFDIVILDHNAPSSGTFHILNMKSVDPQRIIATSSVSAHNSKLTVFGVTRHITKDYSDLEQFSRVLAVHLTDLLTDPKYFENG